MVYDSLVHLLLPGSAVITLETRLLCTSSATYFCVVYVPHIVQICICKKYSLMLY